MGMICATFPSPIDNLKGFSVTPNPDVSLANAFFMEMMLTFILVFIIFTVAFEIVEKPEKGTTLGSGPSDACILVAGAPLITSSLPQPTPVLLLIVDDALVPCTQV